MVRRSIPAELLESEETSLVHVEPNMRGELQRAASSHGGSAKRAARFATAAWSSLARLEPGGGRYFMCGLCDEAEAGFVVRETANRIFVTLVRGRTRKPRFAVSSLIQLLEPGSISRIFAFGVDKQIDLYFFRAVIASPMLPAKSTASTFR